MHYLKKNISIVHFFSIFSISVGNFKVFASRINISIKSITIEDKYNNTLSSFDVNFVIALL